MPLWQVHCLLKQRLKMRCLTCAPMPQVSPGTAAVGENFQGRVVPTDLAVPTSDALADLHTSELLFRRPRSTEVPEGNDELAVAVGGLGQPVTDKSWPMPELHHVGAICPDGGPDELEDFLESQRAHGGGELEAP